MAQHAAGDNVTLDGIAVQLNSWPPNDSGFFTWTQYLAGGATALGTSHTATSTVVGSGALPGDSAGNPAPDTQAVGDINENIGATQ